MAKRDLDPDRVARVVAELAVGERDPQHSMCAASAGVVALWAIVLNDGVRLPWRSRIAITLGLLLGMVSAVRWLSSMMGRHSYGASTWAVWIVLLGGPLVVGSLRLVQLWISPQRNGPRPPASATSAPRSGGPPY